MILLFNKKTYKATGDGSLNILKMKKGVLNSCLI